MALLTLDVDGVDFICFEIALSIVDWIDGPGLGVSAILVSAVFANAFFLVILGAITISQALMIAITQKA
jgi:hypothetical protein